MMSLPDTWEVVYYETESGECPIEQFIDGLRKKEQAKVLARVDLLAEHGVNLRRPYAEYLRDGIYELRVRISRVRYRILYFFCERNRIVVTHGLKKAARRVPETEIDRAVRYKADWLSRC